MGVSVYGNPQHIPADGKPGDIACVAPTWGIAANTASPTVAVTDFAYFAWAGNFNATPPTYTLNIMDSAGGTYNALALPVGWIPFGVGNPAY